MLRPLLLAALLAAPFVSPAAPSVLPSAPDSAGVAQEAPPVVAGRYRPRHVLLQTGGGVGMLSVGGGLSFARRHLDVDGLLGYVPARHAGKALTIVSLKLKYAPWRLPLGKPGGALALTPLAVGLYGSHTFGILNPGTDGRYPDGYYWFSRTTRIGPVLGSSLSYALPAAPNGRARRLAAYYELATNELYLISYYQNRRALSLTDIATLALGLKLEF